MSFFVTDRMIDTGIENRTRLAIQNYLHIHELAGTVDYFDKRVHVLLQDGVYNETEIESELSILLSRLGLDVSLSCSTKDEWF